MHPSDFDNQYCSVFCNCSTIRKKDEWRPCFYLFIYLSIYFAQQIRGIDHVLRHERGAGHVLLTSGEG